ncbi:TetR/AcrR family transcriptional regulator [Amycolatopsis sp. NPDC059021]|uniref:TetR/AcrR family transcriptional regulator n=1 Tax=Amycolatopsis sp. NPDC059021 TaxID=3346704 RepID=UPI003672757D
MPKIVDPEARRLAIAEAVFRVIRRDGLDQASLRAVAEEAGLVIGSVRHYFANHEELIVFAMRTLAERTAARIVERVGKLLDGTTPGSEAALDQTTDLLCELLPLDETRRAEAEVWLAFSAAARIRPALTADAERMYTDTRALTRHSLSEAAKRGSLKDGLDIELETERLAALLDGLTLGGISHPGQAGPDLMRAVVRRHLETLRR